MEENRAEQMEEELKLWDTNPCKARTRSNKRTTIHAIDGLIAVMENYKEYVENIAEEDDLNHTNRVEALRNLFVSNSNYFSGSFRQVVSMIMDDEGRFSHDSK